MCGMENMFFLVFTRTARVKVAEIHTDRGYCVIPKIPPEVSTKYRQVPFNCLMTSRPTLD